MSERARAILVLAGSAQAVAAWKRSIGSPRRHVIYVSSARVLDGSVLRHCEVVTLPCWYDRRDWQEQAECLARQEAKAVRAPKRLSPPSDPAVTRICPQENGDTK